MLQKFAQFFRQGFPVWGPPSSHCPPSTLHIKNFWSALRAFSWFYIRQCAPKTILISFKVGGHGDPRQSSPRQWAMRQSAPQTMCPRDNMPQDNLPWRLSILETIRPGDNMPRDNVPRRRHAPRQCALETSCPRRQCAPGATYGASVSSYYP